MQIVALIKEIPAVLREVLFAPALRTIALIILPYAGLIIGMDVASRYGDVTGQALPVQFFVSQDWSFGETLEYSVMTATAVMLFGMWRRDRSPIYLVNALLFTYLTIDNAVEIHEWFGFWIAPALEMILPDNLPMAANYFGEPLLFLAVGLVWLVGLGLSLRQSRPRPIINSLPLVGCIFMAAFFGIVVDAATDWGPHSVARTDIEAFIEDGGEFVMILVCFFLTTAMYDIEKRRAKALAEGGVAGELPLAA
ncbi:hypothetical protein GRI89_10815 [Altererythrobacter salegens]|uniref:Uncharacterized protein n=1 Tax=Croceibacterium salegens TaxID=1737568 RepID=A0A6I4SY38_9SPHN|nr:hypothetical protein [Croceibacterium salegens]MXO60030.1 hypothetical protein [Croceibacterium salegens]